MKKIYFLIALVAMLSSCSTTTYFQVCKVSSDLPTSANGAYEYKDASCKISYNFWTAGGAVSFIVSNNTNQTLYLDLSKSFLIRNGIAYDYFLNRTTSSTASVASSYSSEVSGSALGYWKDLIKSVPGSITESSAASLGTQKSTSFSYQEKPVVAIPPHAAKVFSEYAIMHTHYADCDLYESPSKEETSIRSFNVSTTPVSFTNRICYRVGENAPDKFIENSFYVSEVSNQHYDATVHKADVGCASDQTRETEYIFFRTSPKEFYMKYTPRLQKKAQTGVNSKKSSDYSDVTNALLMNYNLTFVKRYVRGKEWDVVKEERKELTSEELKQIVDKWKSKTTDKVIYDVQIKKEK